MLSAARGHLKKSAVKVLGYALLAYLVLRLVPGLAAALRDLERVRWEWVAGALLLEALSEVGFVRSWREIIDPENLLARDGRGNRTGTRAAWAQLGGGTLVPGGSLSGVGVGAWILHRLGMPSQRIAERQFNLSFLNTAVDALALVVLGLGLWTGILAGTSSPALTLLPASAAAIGISAALFVARRAETYALRTKATHPKLSHSITTLAAAVDDTRRLLFHRAGVKSVLGAVAYFAFDVLVLWSAFLAIHAPTPPSFAVVAMAYIIGALGGSIPFIPAGLGTVGGIGAMLVVYGAGRNAAFAAVILYEAVGLLVPLVGGSIAYAILRRQLARLRGEPADDSAALGAGAAQR